MAIRRGEARDFEEIARIQAASPEASQWDVSDYAKYVLYVAEDEGKVAGFLVARSLGEGECELLNLAVAPSFRRRGAGSMLILALARDFPGSIFLEVRASNAGALALYKSLGFEVLSSRPGYYENPPDEAIVMKFHSC
jgi:ribosomal-protein-alanine N-acetyltransferase